MSKPTGKCDACGCASFESYSDHMETCPRLAEIVANTNAMHGVHKHLASPPSPIRSGHRDAPDCNCIACALTRGEDRD